MPGAGFFKGNFSPVGFWLTKKVDFSARLPGYYKNMTHRAG